MEHRPSHNSSLESLCIQDPAPQVLMIYVYTLYACAVFFCLVIGVLTAVLAKITKKRILEAYQDEDEIEEYADPEYVESLQESYLVIPDIYVPRGSITNTDNRESLQKIQEEEDEEGEEEDEEEEEDGEDTDEDSDSPDGDDVDNIYNVIHIVDDPPPADSLPDKSASSEAASLSFTPPASRPAKASSTEANLLSSTSAASRPAKSASTEASSLSSAPSASQGLLLDEPRSKPNLKRSTSQARADYLIRLLSRPEEFLHSNIPKSPVAEKRSPTGRKLNMQPAETSGDRKRSSLRLAPPLVFTRSNSDSEASGAFYEPQHNRIVPIHKRRQFSLLESEAKTTFGSLSRQMARRDGVVHGSARSIRE